MMEALAHKPVMLEETMAAIAPHPHGIYADVTAGRGGHAQALLERSAPTGRVLVIDRDPVAVVHVREFLERYGDRVTVVHGEFGDIAAINREHGDARLSGLIADLGVSSPQLDDPARGFSFQASGPLDMRMDPTGGPTVLQLIDSMSERELADTLYRYGDERRSRPIARSIRQRFEAGDLHTTEDLRRAVVRVTGPKRGRVDPATRTFQALRVAVNDELAQLERLLEALPDLLADGGVAAIISFHSLEDRMVKHAFRGDQRLVPLTKRPIQAAEPEQADNPRARSAKLRCARRTPRPDAANEGSI